MDDHRQEVIAYCRENACDGLVAEDAEYAIFDPPRYFSSEQLKLTYKGSLETKEFILNEVAKGLDLHPNRFCVFAALLGNYLLTEEDLLDFYKTICPEAKNKQVIPSDVLIKAVCAYVRALPNIENLDSIGAQVFGSTSNANYADERIQKFKQCVQYYLNGTKDGFLRYRPSNNTRRYDPAHYLPSRPFVSAANDIPQQASRLPVATQAAPAANSVPNDNGTFIADPARFASETVESELSSLTAYQAATSAAQLPAPQIVVEPPTTQNQALATEGPSENSVAHVANSSTENEGEVEQGAVEAQKTGAAGMGPSGVWVNGISSNTSNVDPVSTSKNSPQPGRVDGVNGGVTLPHVPPEVMRTASERHQKGLMSPWIYQILSQGEIKIPLSIEEEMPKELPPACILYRPIRQMVYAILFNLHHMHFLVRQKADQVHNEDKLPEVAVHEWVWTKNNSYRSPEPVKAVPLGWAVPTVQRLWFGATLDDKKRRLRAFLTCMRSDTPLMLNTSNVPQHLLVMCCVLRYIVSCNDRRILRKQELDAFLAQAVSPQLMDAQFMQNMQLPLITIRGVQLAALFMRGVESALFANDSCGAPIPWLMCCPWLFFDGKLFHHKLLKANTAKNLVEICDGQIDQVAKVERMRQAILEDLDVEFARPPLPVMAPSRMPGFHPPPPPPLSMLPASYPVHGRGRGFMASEMCGGRAMPGRRGMLARGGQLEIAGVVVGSWGPNFGAGGRGRSMQMPPQVTSVGGMRRYGTVPGLTIPRGGFTAHGVRRVPARIRGKPPHQVLTPRRKIRKPVQYSPRSGYDEEEVGEKYITLGRGCTIAAVENNCVPPLHPVEKGDGDTGGTVLQNGQFDDAKEEGNAKPVIMKKSHGEGDNQTPNNGASDIVATTNGTKDGSSDTLLTEAE